MIDDYGTNEGFTLDSLASLEAEYAILGALLNDNSAIDRMGDGLKPEHFFSDLNRKIYVEISKQLHGGKGCDVLTVWDALRDHDVGIDFLNKCSQGVHSAANIRRHVALVVERYKSRQLLAVSSDIVELAQAHQTPIADRVEAAQGALVKLLDDAPRDEWIDAYEGMALHTQVLEDRANGKIKSWSTGLSQLDEYLEGGLRPAELVIIGARPSMGKAQPLDAKVLTSGGWSSMGDLKIGDSLSSVDGAPSVVTGIFPQGEKQVFLVTFTDGRTAECCDEHLWRVYHRKWIEPKILSTKEIKRLMQNPTMHKRMWIETLTGDFGDKSSMPVNPWLLGALLGDGNFTNGTIRFSNTADQMLGMVRESLPSGVHLVYAGGCDWRITRTSSAEKNPLTNAMLSLGLMGARSETKFVPEIYMKADKNTRLSVLRGLMDTDGWVEKCGSVLFSSSSQQLAKDVQDLARSLGYWCSIKEKNTGYKKNGDYHPCQTAYVLSISGDETHDLFLFDKKKSRCINKSRPKRVVFLKIEESRRSLCQCISVSHKSHLYITDNYVVTHNTAIAMTVGLEMAREYSVGFLSMEMSHSEVRDRMTAMLGNVSLSSVKRPNKGQGLQWDRVVEGANKAQSLNFYVSDQGGLNINQVRSKARNLKRMKGLNVLIIDYIGLMTGLDQKQNRNTQLEEVSRGLKNLAKELDISIVCLAQLNRKSEERPEQMPMMSDLRDCGAIEQDADVIVFIKRPIMANPELGGAWQDYAKLSIAKNRQGRCGYLNLSYMGEQTRFSEWHGEAPRKEVVQQKRGMN